MAQIYNTDLIKELKDGAKAQQLRDTLPSQLAEKVVPVMEVNPKLLRTINVVNTSTSGTSAATVTVISADPNNDFYLTSINIGIIKDATCDAASGALTANIQTLNGATVSFASIPLLTLTAQSENLVLSLPIPLKIDKNSTIKCTVPTFTVGNCRVVMGATGYKVYNSNA